VLDHHDLEKSAILVGFLGLQNQAKGLAPIYLRHLVSTRCKDFFLRGDRGYRLALNGLTQDAHLLLKKAARIYGPLAPQVLAESGKVTILAQNKCVEATALAREALARIPDDAALLTLLGCSLYGQEYRVQAESTLRPVLERDPEPCANHAAHFVLGNIFLLDHRIDEARLSFERAYAVLPYDVKVVRMLVQTLCALNKPAKGQRWFEKAAAMAPDHAVISAEVGTLWRCKNCLPKADPIWKRPALKMPKMRPSTRASPTFASLVGRLAGR
jgi:tetratricopeptide (TPR) repeat protein